MKVRVPRSTYLAVQRARTSVLLGVDVEAREVGKILDCVEILAGMVRARSAHIGNINTIIADMIEEGVIDGLPEGFQERLVNAFEVGTALAVDNSGFSDGTEL